MKKPAETLNDGAIALRNCGQTQAQIARALGVSRTIVGKWWAGTKTPGPEHRVRLEALGWVRSSQWDQGGSGRAGRAAPAAPMVTPDTPVPPTAPQPLEHVDTATELREQVGRYRLLLQDQKLSADARVKAERGLSAVLAALARVEGTQITESTIMRHPAWRRLWALVITALKDNHPDALVAISELLHAREA